jgi:RNA polymerase subunit RPABC4/transcription elongation factor Spt4
MAKNKHECPSCAMMIDEKAQECPICGYEFPKQSSGLKWVAYFLLALILFYFILRIG